MSKLACTNVRPMRKFGEEGCRIRELYLKKYANMTLSKNASLRSKWLPPRHVSLTLEDVLSRLGALVDQSDPDFTLSNKVHAFQAAEEARRLFPDDEGMHLTALIHDLGKIMSCWSEDQAYVVGDTYPLARPIHPSLPYSDSFNQLDATVNYPVGCGLREVEMTWGHDEYLYSILRNCGCTLPEVYLDIIRFHSFYAWHTHGGYVELESSYDREVLQPAIARFNRCDLYSKSNGMLTHKECNSLWEDYYHPLAVKYGLGGKILW